MKGNWKVFFALLGIVLISLFVVANNDKFNTGLTCGKHKEFKGQEFSGVVVKKYMDKNNHQIRTIALGEKETIILASDTSGFYSFVQENDSIVKERKADFLTVHRMGEIFKFKIYFGCSDKSN